MGRRNGRTERTEAEIAEAFWSLYAEKPVEKITVGQVCERAGYNRGTFYLHYRDIYDLLETIEESLLDGMASCVEQCMKRLGSDRGKASLLAACKDVVLYYERNRRYIIVLFSTQGDPSFVFRLKERLKPLWRLYVVGPGCDRSESEIDLLLEFALSGTLYMISSWLASPDPIPAHRLAHLVYDFSIKDVSARF